MPQSLALVLFAVYGALLGSFANVVIWRVPQGLSVVTPGSQCPKCTAAIHWYDNVPMVSWLLLRGRCRHCGVPISMRYPLVEALSAALFLAAALAFGTNLSGVSAALLFWALLVLSFIDLDTMRLPNAIVGPLALLGYALAALSQVTGVRIVPLVGLAPAGAFSSPLASAAAGSVLGAGISLAIAAAYAGVRGRSGFGMGDVKLLAALGPFLGPYTLLVLMLGSLVGAVGGIVAAARGGDRLAVAKIPFGPYLAGAAVAAAIAGPLLWGWYVGLVGLA